jgi:type I restriction enzyme R subunit
MSQMFDYGNTEIEKRFIFLRLLTPLLEFGREREGIDLSTLRLTHHTMRDLGRQRLALSPEGGPKLEPDRPGGGQVQDKQKARLEEIIRRLNDLFEGELTENDKLIYADWVIKGKLLESELLRRQAQSNSKEQFANSPDLRGELVAAVMESFDAHQSMSRQMLESERRQIELLDILMGPGRLWEGLRADGGRPPAGLEHAGGFGV